MNKTIKIIIFVILIISLAFKLIQQVLFGYQKQSWQVSEFLINYSGGFVRRGALGEILLFLNSHFGMPAYPTIVIFSILCLLSLWIFFIYHFKKNKLSLFFLPFVFILGNPIINDFWLRKDVLILLLFIGFINQLRKLSIHGIAFANIFLSVAILCHELIAFYSIPFFVFFLYRNSRILNFKNLFESFLKISPTILVFLAVIYHKGTPDITEKIWKSWENVYFPFDTLKTDSNSIDALSWSIEKGIALFTKTIHNFDNHIYAPFALIITFLVIYLFLSSFFINNVINKETNSEKQGVFGTVLLFQLVCIIPLIILGWDYGRWAFHWVISAFVIVLLVPEASLKKTYPHFFVNLNNKIINQLKKVFGKNISQAVYFIGIPGYSWKLYSFVTTSALFIIFEFFSTIRKYLSLIISF